MSRYILDTDILVALVDTKDKWHRRASSISDAMIQMDVEGLFFDCVVSEAISVICKRLEERGRERELSDLLKRIKYFAPKEEIIWILKKTEDFYEDILRIIERSNGRLNFHDALIALIARELDIRHIVSFDKDFDEIEWLTRVKDTDDLKEKRPKETMER